MSPGVADKAPAVEGEADLARAVDAARPSVHGEGSFFGAPLRRVAPLARVLAEGAAGFGVRLTGFCRRGSSLDPGGGRCLNASLGVAGKMDLADLVGERVAAKDQMRRAAAGMLPVFAVPAGRVRPDIDPGVPCRLVGGGRVGPGARGHRPDR